MYVGISQLGMNGEFFRRHLIYIHIIKRPAKRTPTPSLHKDIDLGVPTSPLRFYLRGLERVMVLGAQGG